MKRMLLTILAVCFTGVAATAQFHRIAPTCDDVAASPLDASRPRGIPGVPPEKINAKVAIPVCEDAARAAPNDPRILFQLGRAYGAAKAYESARTYYAKADALGYALATNNLANLYEEGLGIPAADLGRAHELLKKAADAGAPIAMDNLGIWHRDGKHVAKNHALARQWFLRAAEAQYPNSMIRYAHMLYNGEGGAENWPEARRWYRRAGEAGNVEGMNNTAYMLGAGEGGPKDFVDTRRWYRMAAEAGSPHAMHNYGVMLLDGEGGPKDFVSARHWFQAGAEAGHARAMTSYGYMLSRGLGGHKDKVEARQWYEKAAALGEKKAQENLAAMDRPSERRRSGSRGGRGGGYSQDRSPGLSNRGRPCFLPSEQAMGGC